MSERGPIMKDGIELNGQPTASSGDHLDPPASAITTTSAKPVVVEDVTTAAGTNSPLESSRSSKKKTLEALCSIRCHYNSMAHLKSVEEFYSPRKIESLDSADKILQITFSACTPRLLVRPSQPTPVLNPDSYGVYGDKDITSSEMFNVSDLDDGTVESSTETGWSVRDNPIASNASCKRDVDSDEEDLERNVCSKNTAVSDNNQDNISTLTTPSVEHVLLLDSEEEVPDDEDERVPSPALAPEGFFRCKQLNPSASKVLYLSDERVIKPYVTDDAESTRRARKVISRSSSYNPPQKASRSLIVEDICSCSGKEQPDVKKASGEGGNLSKGGLEVEVLSPPAYLLSVQLSGRIVDVVSKTWKTVLCYSDLVLGGSLLIALALPFAIMVSKLIVSSTQDQFRFVPT